MNENNNVYQKAYSFALRVVKAYRHLTVEQHEYILSKQLLKCGTSIGANLAEAIGAISRAELSAKIAISYKETQETKYWLNLLKDSGYIEKKAFDSMFNDANEIGAILFSILKSTRYNRRKVE